MSKRISVSKALGEALREEMQRDDKVILMGEDMAVMGNVFGITKGFLEEFGEQRDRYTDLRGRICGYGSGCCHAWDPSGSRTDVQ